MNGFGEFLQGGTPGEGMGTPWLFFVSVTKQAQYGLVCSL
jgi:hypothetical protein